MGQSSFSVHRRCILNYCLDIIFFHTNARHKDYFFPVFRYHYLLCLDIISKRVIGMSYSICIHKNLYILWLFHILEMLSIKSTILPKQELTKMI